MKDTPGSIPDASGAPPEAAELHDMQIPEQRGWRFLFLVLFILPFIVAFTVLIVVVGNLLPGAPLHVYSISVAVLVGLALHGMLGLWRRSVHRTVDGALSRQSKGAITDVTREIFGGNGRAWNQSYFQALARFLPAHGRVNVTIRNCPVERPPQIAPINVPFEARELDEADESVLALGGEATAKRADGTQNGSTPRADGDSDAFVRRLRRNVALRGGWVLFVISGAMFALGVWETLGAGRVSFFLACGSLGLLGTLFGFERWSSRQRWLVVPGGLLVRKGRWPSAKSTLHLFDRRRSVLIVHRQGKRQWVAHAGDEAADDQAAITPREVAVLLGGWLSPLTPPPLGRMSDLT